MNATARLRMSMTVANPITMSSVRSISSHEPARRRARRRFQRQKIVSGVVPEECGHGQKHGGDQDAGCLRWVELCEMWRRKCRSAEEAPARLRNRLPGLQNQRAAYGLVHVKPV